MHPDMRAIDYVKEASDYIETADGAKISASQMIWSISIFI